MTPGQQRRPAPAPARPRPGWTGWLAAAAELMACPTGCGRRPSGGRRSAVLILFGEDAAGPDVLLVAAQPVAAPARRASPRSPAARSTPQDGGPVAAALREAAEEALRRSGRRGRARRSCPSCTSPRSGFSVTPVLAWWRQPGPVGPGDPAEVDRGPPGPVAELADPGQPADPSGIRPGRPGPAFRAAGMLVWGFTGLVVDRLLTLGGWERALGHVAGHAPAAGALAAPGPEPAPARDGPPARKVPGRKRAQGYDPAADPGRFAL